MLLQNPKQDAKARLTHFYQAIAITRKHIQFLSKMANEKGQGRKKDYQQTSPDKCFGIPRVEEDRDAIKRVASQAAAPLFRPGSLIDGRTVDPSDYDRWEEQRKARKRRNNTVDPYR